MVNLTRVVIFLVTLTSTAWSSANLTMDCGSDLIVDDLRAGTTQYEILQACGQPVDSFANSWIYTKQGGGLYILTFDGLGQLMAIDHRIR